MKNNCISIKHVQLEKKGRTYRISAEVNGEPLWFESEDAPLSPSPEAFANALLVPAMIQGTNLEFTDPLCNEWLENSNKLMKIYNDWFDWEIISINSPKAEPSIIDRGNKIALCFSGGVDSFHSLFTYPKEISYLVMVHGYDIALSDTKGADIVFNHIKGVADEIGLPAIKITTNYRHHGITGKKYRYSFEGALAAISNLITDINELVISSDYSREALQNFNACSHWMTAPLRSTKETNFTHYGDTFTRDEKLRQIAKKPLLKKHLRVCQENLKPSFHFSSDALNCGECDKCIRTIISLMQEGALEGSTVFQSTNNIYQKIDAINSVPSYSLVTYAELINLGLDEKLTRSINALIMRTNFINKNDWLSRRGIKVIALCFRVAHKIQSRSKQLFKNKHF